MKVTDNQYGGYPNYIWASCLLLYFSNFDSPQLESRSTPFSFLTYLHSYIFQEAEIVTFMRKSSLFLLDFGVGKCRTV